MSGPLTATVDVGGPFKIETKPYNIAAKVVLAADDKLTPPVTESTIAEAPPETPKVEPTPVTAQTEETMTTKKKGANWIILTALIGLGVAAAGFAVYKKTV